MIKIEELERRKTEDLTIPLVLIEILRTLQSIEKKMDEKSPIEK
jgi:hypothetical protein